MVLIFVCVLMCFSLQKNPADRWDLKSLMVSFKTEYNIETVQLHNFFSI